MKKQIVKINDKYAARIKKWYHIRWRYLGIITFWIEIPDDASAILVDTIKEAESKYYTFFPKIRVVKNEISE